MSVIEIKPGETKIGWVGTGVMGKSMLSHLMKAGFSATIFSRTKSKAEGLIAEGASWADSPKAVAEIVMNQAVYSTPIIANNVLFIATRNTLYAIAFDGKSP